MAGRSLARLAGAVLADGGIADPLHYRHLALAPEPTDTIPHEIAGTGRRRAHTRFLLY